MVSLISCSKCPSTFKFKRSLKSHVLKAHKIIKKEKVEVTSEEESRSTSKLLVRNHKLTEHDGFPSNLLEKRKTNSQMQNYKNYKKSLKRALKVSNIKIKKEAIEVSEKQKRFDCDKCGKSFCNLPNLQRHDDGVHLGVKFNCDRCEQTFSQKSNLKNHIDSVHERYRYQCKVCSFNHTKKSKIIEHLEEEHQKTGAVQEIDFERIPTAGLGTPSKSPVSKFPPGPSPKSAPKIPPGPVPGPTHIDLQSVLTTLSCPQNLPSKTPQKLPSKTPRKSPKITPKHTPSPKTNSKTPRKTPPGPVPKTPKSTPKTISKKQKTPPKKVKDIKLVEFYCDLCMYETEEENALTNHLAMKHYDDIFGRAIVLY